MVDWNKELKFSLRRKDPDDDLEFDDADVVEEEPEAAPEPEPVAVDGDEAADLIVCELGRQGPLGAAALVDGWGVAGPLDYYVPLALL